MIRKLTIIAAVILIAAVSLPGFARGKRDADKEKPAPEQVVQAGEASNGEADPVPEEVLSPDACDGDRVPADWNTVQTGDMVRIEGRIRLVGSASSNSLMVTDLEGNDWYIDEPERQLLARMEQREARLVAVIRRDPVIFANGKQLEDKRVLTEIGIEE